VPKVEPIAPYLEPLHKAVTVKRRPEEAFEVFTAGLARWWPLARYSISQERARSCAIEPFVGGAIYEVRDDGERCAWGRVLVWEPPRRFAVTWHPGRDPDTAQEVEVRFLAEGDATRVELEHRGWAKLGERAAETRESYAGGWDVVLGAHFVPACERRDG
jgi:uncharacterized protein YndB with AHSA1/START domain